MAKAVVARRAEETTGEAIGALVFLKRKRPVGGEAKTPENPAILKNFRSALTRSWFLGIRPAAGLQIS